MPCRYVTHSTQREQSLTDRHGQDKLESVKEAIACVICTNRPATHVYVVRHCQCFVETDLPYWLSASSVSMLFAFNAGMNGTASWKLLVTAKTVMTGGIVPSADSPSTPRPHTSKSISSTQLRRRSMSS